MVWMCHSLFSHSPVEGPGLIPVSGLVSKVSINMHELQFSFLWTRYPGVQLLGHTIAVLQVLFCKKLPDHFSEQPYYFMFH